MSYSICRIAKVKASGVTGIQIHDRREKGVSHTNEDIDWNKTGENIDLLEQGERFRTVVKNRIDELQLSRALRSDATVMCQCLITSDNAFFEKMSKGEQVEFFKKSLDFIKDRYGEKNMVSATVHFDERTPHMHVNFVPVTQDGRLSARDLFSPKQLRELQDDFNKSCKENGYELDRGELHSKREHLSVEEYKVQTKYAELKEKQADIENKAVKLEQQRGALKNDLKALKNDLEVVQGVKIEFDEINAIEAKYGVLNKDKVTINSTDFEKLKNIAKKQHVLQSENELLKRDNLNMKSDINKFSDSRSADRNKILETEKQLKIIKKEYTYLAEYLRDTGQVDEAQRFIDSKKSMEKELKKQINKSFELER